MIQQKAYLISLLTYLEYLYVFTNSNEYLSYIRTQITNSLAIINTKNISIPENLMEDYEDVLDQELRLIVTDQKLLSFKQYTRLNTINEILL